MATPTPMPTSLTGTFESIAVEDNDHKSSISSSSSRRPDDNTVDNDEMESTLADTNRQNNRLSPSADSVNVTEISADGDSVNDQSGKASDSESERQDNNSCRLASTPGSDLTSGSNGDQSISDHSDRKGKAKSQQHHSKSQVPRADSLKRKSDVLEESSGADSRQEETCKKGAPAALPAKTESSVQDSVSPAGSRCGKDSPNTFVKDWEFLQTLGEGAYGEVKLAYNVKTKEAVAVKIIDFATKTTNPTTMDDIRKEVCIHRMINHPNIIRFYGVRKDGNVQYLFLEYASGGELFDRIEPDVGMPQAEAQRYFRQLIDGLEYLHSKGIAHRDIKPENLLLDENDTLKIADFGLATIFRHQGKWRYLERVCGSAPYLAPEVISRPYKAEPADIWSCGIVLVAMLGGELPWDAPVLACVQYCEWRECHIENKPWSKIDNLALCLIRRLLSDKPDRRYTMEEIRKNQWFKKDFSKDPVDQLCAGPKRFRSGTDSGWSPGLVSLSQPEISRSSREAGNSRNGSSTSGAGSNMANDCKISFSQPAQTDDMLLSSQLNGTQSSQTPLQKLVRRMTRFFTKHPRSEVVAELDRVFSCLVYSWKYNTNSAVTVHTSDRRQCPLTFKVMILDMGESQLVDFRLSKGDGLEFKRQFLRIRELMKTIICKVPPTWPNLPDL